MKHYSCHSCLLVDFFFLDVKGDLKGTWKSGILLKYNSYVDFVLFSSACDNCDYFVVVVGRSALIIISTHLFSSMNWIFMIALVGKTCTCNITRTI